MREVTGYFAMMLSTLCVVNAAIGQMQQPSEKLVASSTVVNDDSASVGEKDDSASVGEKIERSAGVRIVRLSATRGPVDLDRQTGRGYETGFVNLPIVEGNKLRTGDLAWAEVELEDDSTLRVTPNSVLVFHTLTRADAGTTRSGVTLSQGTLYVSRTKKDTGEVTVTAQGRRLVLPPASHVRLDVYPGGSELVVVQGLVHVEEAGNVFEVDKHHALKFGGASQTAQLVIAKDEAPGLYDQWDAAAANYHKGNGLVKAASAGNSYAYGNRDLGYYGSFQNVSGCGQVWQPYLAGANFSPFSNGTWAWYPSAGYTFVSPYSWGWTTFHSGDWVSCGANGWGWRPGSWTGLNNYQKLKPGGKPVTKPQPLLAPAPGKPTFVAVSEAQAPRSKMYVDRTATIAPESAGLGIPRGSIENLREISRAVAMHTTLPAARFAVEPEAIDPQIAAAAHTASKESPGARANSPRAAGTLATNPLSRPVAVVAAGQRPGGYNGRGYSNGRSADFSPGASGSGIAGGSRGSSTGHSAVTAGVGAGASGSAGHGGSSGGGHK